MASKRTKKGAKRVVEGAFARALSNPADRPIPAPARDIPYPLDELPPDTVEDRQMNQEQRAGKNRVRASKTSRVLDRRRSIGKQA
jgi:hypothetical protein